MLLVRNAADLISATGDTTGVTLAETIVHASADESREAKLRDWLTNWLDRQPSYDVKIRTRRPRRHPVHCRACDTLMTNCPNCSTPLTISEEKGVDSALVTDLLSLAWQRAYDVAVLVSGDADLHPGRGVRAEPGPQGDQRGLAEQGASAPGACWGSFPLDKLIPDLTR
jgi:hypothetical protein